MLFNPVHNRYVAYTEQTFDFSVGESFDIKLQRLRYVIRIDALAKFFDCKKVVAVLAMEALAIFDYPAFYHTV